jgi:hypothetical protein
MPDQFPLAKVSRPEIVRREVDVTALDADLGGHAHALTGRRFVHVVDVAVMSLDAPGGPFGVTLQALAVVGLQHLRVGGQVDSH